MAFDLEPSRTPTAIGNITIILADQPEPVDLIPPVRKKASFQLRVLDQDGILIRELAGDLEPHLTQPEKDQLIAFMNTLRQRAIDQILGGTP